LHRKIKDLKTKLCLLQGKNEPITETQDLELQEKNKIIEEILQYQPELKTLISLYKYNVKELQFHLSKLIEKKQKGELITYIKERKNIILKENIVIKEKGVTMQSEEKKTGKRGRQAEAGTYEAREFVSQGNVEKLLEPLTISAEAKARILKAIKFGLGVK